jgi:hypothetical protein
LTLLKKMVSRFLSRKEFDFNDETAFRHLMAAAKGRKAASQKLDKALASGTVVISAFVDNTDEVSRMTGPAPETPRTVALVPSKVEILENKSMDKVEEVFEPEVESEVIEHEVIELEIHEPNDTIEVTNSGEIYTLEEAMTKEAISKMFFLSSEGSNAKELGEQFCNMDAILDLIDIFVANNFSEAVTAEMKREIAADLMEQIQQSKTDDESKPEPTPVVVDVTEIVVSPRPQEIIHLEDYPTPEPKAFIFDGYQDPSEASTAAPDEVSVTTSKASRRPRITPESVETLFVTLEIVFLFIKGE